MPLVSKSFSIDIVPGKTPPTIHVSEKDIGRLYYISIVDDGTPFSIPSGTTAKVEGTIGPYGFSENADVINNTIIVTLRSKMTAIKGKVWTKIKLTNNGDIASTCAFWLDVDKAGAVEGHYIDPGTIPDPGGDGGLSLEGFVQYNEPQALSESEKAQARANIGAAAAGEGGGGDGSFPVYTPQDFGAVGDMEHDDTQAFKDAFAASSRGGTVFVPDGRYRLTDTIKIPRWGMMILSGSVELRFFDMDDGNGGWKPCIKLLLYARLKGNGSLVIVDYNYKGHAIELYTDEDPLHQSNEPFVQSNPAWRQSRDVDDIAVLKRCSSTDATTAVYDIRNIGGDGIYIGAEIKSLHPFVAAGDSRNFQWTTHVKARVAGGFENGFHLELKDKEESWMSDTYISGVVENAETAVLIDKITGGVYCDVTFQPVRCYPNKLPVWSQPTSEENGYEIGAQVHYPTINDPIYESETSENMNSPDGSGWHRAEEYVDDPRQLYSVWDSSKAPYQTGNRVHYPTENDPVYESDVDNNAATPNGNGWHRARQYVSDDPIAYVKNGVKVIGSANVDMSRTKIWDWLTTNTLVNTPDKDGNYSHKPYALIGACRSATISDFGMDDSRLPFFDRIYTNSIGNLFTATVKSAKGILPVPPKYAFYKNYQYKVHRYNYLNMAWRDPQNMMRYQMPFRPLYPGSNTNRLYQLGYFDFADAEVPESGYDDTLVRQTITIEENDDRGLYGYTNLFFEENVVEARWNPVGYGTGGHIPIYFYSEDGVRRYIYKLVRDNTDIQQIYNCQLYITNARRFVFDFADKGAIGSLSADTYKLIQPSVSNAQIYLPGSVAVQNGIPVICTEPAVFGRNGVPTTPAVVKELALAENVSGGCVFTPEQFGAVGDGNTDDTKAIQAAFDAAANGGTVKFGRQKTYLVSKQGDQIAYVSGATHPNAMHYMLRIHGSITILGNGATLKEPEITQAVYDGEYPIRYDPEQRNSACMIFLDNAERRSSDASDNAAEINDRNYVIIRGLVMEGNCKNVERNLDHGGGAGAWWKAIYANSARGIYLELNSVTIRNFAGEGVHAMSAPGSKFRAFGCTFENCTPSAWNCGGSLAEAIGCTFNCTDPTSHASEYVSQKTIFDSCTFNTEAMRPILLQGKAGTELIVRNSIFNTSATAKPIPTIYTVYYDGGFTAEKYWQSGTVYLFARSSGSTFALATELQDGQDFLITNVDSGSGYALAKNTDGSLKSVAVTVSSGSVTLSDTSAVWVCSTNTNGFVLKNHEQTVVPSDSEDEGGEHQGDLVDAYLTCNAANGLLTSASFASTRWWSYSENQLKLRITPPQYLPTIYTRDSQNVFIDSCVFNNQRASEDEEAIVTTKSLQYGKVNNCTFSRTTMSADSVFYPVFAGQAQNNIVKVTNYPAYPDGASIVGRGMLIQLSGLSKYKFNMISAPKSFTIIPSATCNLVAWGFGTRVINVNVPVYAHARAKFNVDYSSLPSAPYYNKDLAALRNFFVECDKPVNIIIET